MRSYEPVLESFFTLKFFLAERQVRRFSNFALIFLPSPTNITRDINPKLSRLIHAKNYMDKIDSFHNVLWFNKYNKIFHLFKIN